MSVYIYIYIYVCVCVCVCVCVWFSFQFFFSLFLCFLIWYLLDTFVQVLRLVHQTYRCTQFDIKQYSSSMVFISSIQKKHVTNRSFLVAACYVLHLLLKWNLILWFCTKSDTTFSVLIANLTVIIGKFHLFSKVIFAPFCSSLSTCLVLETESAPGQNYPNIFSLWFVLMHPNKW